MDKKYKKPTSTKAWWRTLHTYENTPQVEEYTLNGKLLKTYKNVWEAAEKNTTNARRILRVINGKKKSYHGLTYKFKKDE